MNAPLYRVLRRPVCAAATLLAWLLLMASASAHGPDTTPASATPIGAWLGIARPCTPPVGGGIPLGEDGQPISDFLEDLSTCHKACGGSECEANVFPPLQVTMIPTLLADGTVLADDFAAFLDGHTTAHGKWE